MRILYDYQAFDIQRSGGVSNVFSLLVDEVKKREEVSVGIASTNNLYMLAQGYPSEEYTFARLINAGKLDPRRAINDIDWKKVNRIYSKNAIKYGDYDIFHPTHYDPYFLEYIKKPYVVTIHDLAFERLRDYIQFNESMCLADFDNRRDIMASASKVVAISEATKKDIIDIYKVPENKIDVVYNAYRELPENYEYNNPFNFPYILYVGTRQGPLNYKCFIPFFNQIVPFLKEHKDFKLICTGQKFTKFELDMFRQYRLEDRVENYYLNEDGLNNLYHHAFCFVFPSEFEGFGLPILEAYKNDCPAILNNIPVFHEVAGDCGQYFDITDGKSLNERLEHLFELKEDDRNALILKQKERLPLFTADKMAEGYINVYKSVLK